MAAPTGGSAADLRAWIGETVEQGSRACSSASAPPELVPKLRVGCAGRPRPPARDRLVVREQAHRQDGAAGRNFLTSEIQEIAGARIAEGGLERYERAGHRARVEASADRLIDRWGDVLDRLDSV